MNEAHKFKRRVLQWGFPDAMAEMTEVWEGVEDYQTFLDRACVWAGTPITANEIQAKEADFNVWKAGQPARDKSEAVKGLLADRKLRAFFKVAAEQWGMTPAQLKAAVKAKM